MNSVMILMYNMNKYINKILNNKNQLGYYIFYLPRKLFFKYCSSYFDKKIAQLVISKNVKTDEDEMLLFSSFKVGSEDRQNIMAETLKVTFKEFEASFGGRIEIADSSDGKYFEENKLMISNILKKNISFNLQNKKASLPQSYSNILYNSKERFFTSFFDDQPIVGLTTDFLLSACTLLADFNNFVGLIAFEYPSKYILDHKSKKIVISLEDIEFKSRKIELIRIVKYGKYSFAILRNYHYGFFFNNMIGRTRDYCDKLAWYMKHINTDSPHEIELAGMRKIGPVYNYIAVPMNVFMLDLDFVHTDIAIRISGEINKDLFEAVKNGYEINYK